MPQDRRESSARKIPRRPCPARGSDTRKRRVCLIYSIFSKVSVVYCCQYRRNSKDGCIALSSSIAGYEADIVIRLSCGVTVPDWKIGLIIGLEELYGVSSYGLESCLYNIPRTTMLSQSSGWGFPVGIRQLWGMFPLIIAPNSSQMEEFD